MAVLTDRRGALLPPLAAAHLFAPLGQMTVGLIHSPHTGNCGDRLIEVAAEQLLADFGIRYWVQEPDAESSADVLLLFGGGNYGHPFCQAEADRRQAALATGKPCVLLPQTAYGIEPGEYWAAYARETTSLAMIPGSVLGPDLALCYRPIERLPADVVRCGEFFTTSPEGLWPGRGMDIRHSFFDPADYLAFIARHTEIHTDCLHVAICGLIAGREVTLYGTRLHKQRSMWETWLAHFGCRWGE